MSEYDPKAIEPKWQEKWEKEGFYPAKDFDSKPKWYSLMEFPYPSGDGLHTGHVRGYTAMDIISRKRRMEGYNVLFPIGWDAFGLPTENYAIKTGKDPRIVTKENTDNFRNQFKKLGMSFDWSREVNTTDPKYYKWTQWIFLKLLENGLAYKAKMPINWCPKDKIGLANEEVIDGKCERCGTEVEQKEKEQWMLAITKYADKLLEGLDSVDYPERVKAQQRNWIGRSEGAEIEFPISNSQSSIKVFTTRPDTIFGATFLVKAGKEDKFTGEYAINPATKEEIPVWDAEYVLSDYGTGAIMGVPAHDERDYEFAKKHNLLIKQAVAPHFQLDGEDGLREGVETLNRRVVDAIIENDKGEFLLMKEEQNGVSAVHFVGGGTEGDDEIVAVKKEITEETGYTDFEVIGKICLDLCAAGFRHTKNKNQITIGPGFHVRLKSEKRIPSEVEEGKHSIFWVKKDAVESQITWPGHMYIWKSFLSQKPIFTGEGILINSGSFDGLLTSQAKEKITEKFGKKVIRYKLRDWVFSRQRYWGEPIPVIHCEKCGIVPVPEKDLPVTLPEVENYTPTDTGESPLAKIDEWVNVECHQCGGMGKRETDVMPNWAGSSWYFLRYLNPQNDEEFVSQDRLNYWMPVDWYNGGMEHTTLHLLYSRFWNQFLHDIGLVPFSEPYKKRTSHGLILAEGGQKMSKSLGNVINPDGVIERFGADTLRLYEMFMGPFEQAIAWSEDALVGPRRFIEKVWRMKEKIKDGPEESSLLHQTIKKVGDDIEDMRFNTAISAMMIFANDIEKRDLVSKPEAEKFMLMLAPFVPHVAEEIWQLLGHNSSIHRESWPSFDPGKLEDSEVTIVVQINGKMRGKFAAEPAISEAKAFELAEALPEIQKWVGDKAVKARFYVPKKLVNIVLN